MLRMTIPPADTVDRIGPRRRIAVSAPCELLGYRPPPMSAGGKPTSGKAHECFAIPRRTDAGVCSEMVPQLHRVRISHGPGDSLNGQLAVLKQAGRDA